MKVVIYRQVVSYTDEPPGKNAKHRGKKYHSNIVVQLDCGHSKVYRWWEATQQRKHGLPDSNGVTIKRVRCVECAKVLERLSKYD